MIRSRVALERFRAKACPALDAGWDPVLVKKTRQNKRLEPPFRFNRNEKALDFGSKSAAGQTRLVLVISAAARCLLSPDSDLLTARQRNDAMGPIADVTRCTIVRSRQFEGAKACDGCDPEGQCIPTQAGFPCLMGSEVGTALACNQPA